MNDRQVIVTAILAAVIIVGWFLLHDALLANRILNCVTAGQDPLACAAAMRGW